ncbi:MAG TPA: alpha/beta hydrolase [Ramlibacter sp.]|nr:alpha/beta hydrolase [Ramlibacter sp.]
MSEVLSPAALPADAAAWMGRLPQRHFTDAAGHAWAWRDNLRPAPAIVLLPGALGNGDMAFRMADGLSDAMRTLSITYPSGLPADVLAAGLAALLDHLALDTVAVWGSSYGAWWSQAFAASHPERVTALWLGNMPLDGGAVAGHPLFAADWLERSTADDVAAAWQEALLRQAPTELRALQLWMLEHGLPAAALRARLLQVANAPVLPVPAGVERMAVADCENDGVIAAAQRERVHQRYPRADHLRLPSGGHYPHVTRAPDVLAALRAWLDLSSPSQETER